MLIVLKGRIISTEDSLFDLSVFRNKALDIRNRKYVGEEFSKKKHKSKKLDLRILGLKKEVQNNKPSFCSGSCDEWHATKNFQKQNNLETPPQEP